MAIQALSVDAVRTDGGTQMRASLPSDAVSDYASIWIDAGKKGNPFPAVVVFFDGSDYWLADGHLRLAGARKAGRASITCEVKNGTLRDAQLYACGANAEHGARRTNADKRKAVTTLLKDDEWQNRSDRWIAESCKVSHPLVASIRKEIESPTGNSSSCDTETPTNHESSAANNDGAESPPDSSDPVSSNGSESEEPDVQSEIFSTSHYDGWLKKLGEFGNWCEEECKTQRGSVLAENRPSIRADVKNLQQAIRFSKPHAACPDCDGFTNGDLITQCDTCKGRGWLTKEIYSQLPPEVKLRATVR